MILLRFKELQLKITMSSSTTLSFLFLVDILYKEPQVDVMNLDLKCIFWIPMNYHLYLVWCLEVNERGSVANTACSMFSIFFTPFLLTYIFTQWAFLRQHLHVYCIQLHPAAVGIFLEPLQPSGRDTMGANCNFKRMEQNLLIFINIEREHSAMWLCGISFSLPSFQRLQLQESNSHCSCLVKEHLFYLRKDFPSELSNFLLTHFVTTHLVIGRCSLEGMMQPRRNDITLNSSWPDFCLLYFSTSFFFTNFVINPIFDKLLRCISSSVSR